MTKLEHRSGAVKFFFAVHGIILDFWGFCQDITVSKDRADKYTA